MSRRSSQESLRPPLVPPRVPGLRRSHHDTEPVEMPEAPEGTPRGAAPAPEASVRVHVGLTVLRPSGPLTSSPPVREVIDALSAACSRLGHPYVLHVGSD
jgi:hypothetical protein